MQTKRTTTARQHRPHPDNDGRARAKKRPVAPDDLLRLQLVSDPQISPDGRTLLFSKRHVGEKNEYVTNLWTVPADGGESRQFTSAGKDGHGRWSADGRTIAFLSGRDKPASQVFTIAADGGEARPLTRFPEGKIATFKWSPDGTRLAVAFRETDPGWTEEAKKRREETGGSTPPRVLDDLWYRLDGDGWFNDRRFKLFIVDAASGEHRLLFDRDTLGTFTFDWSPDSAELVVAANTSRNALLKPWKDDLFRVDAGSGKVTKIAGLPVGHKTEPRWSPDGLRIAWAGREGKEHWGVNNTRLYIADADGRNVRDLTGHTDYCLSAITVSDTAEVSFGANIAWTPDGGRVVMNFGWHGGYHVASIAAEGGDVVFHTSGRQTVGMGNFSADGGRLALSVADQLTLTEAGVGEWQDGETAVEVLTDFNRPLLDGLDLSPAEPHWIESSADARVQVWVMKPPGFKPGKKYPAVLEIHGGPHTQYGETFFHEFQVLAAAGYVVVYSNPRGSKGYGEAHCKAIKGQWGHADWEDLQAVTAFMKEQPYIRSKHMGVMGGSYGGYMTNWVIGHTRDFAAAVTDRCVSNLVSMVGTSDLPLVPGEYWDGNSWDNTEGIWSQSPLKHFGNVETPTLVIHSEGDLRCNIEQAEQVFAALQLRGVPSRFVRYPTSASHGMSRSGPPDLRLHRLGQILEWWGRYLA